jgi:hypothetical protein
MNKLRTTIALAVTMALLGCQTVDGVRVNGMQFTGDARAQAQPGRSGWVWAALGIAGAIGVGFLAGGGGGSGGGITSGGGSVGGTGAPTGPVDPCNGCWDDAGPKP